MNLNRRFRSRYVPPNWEENIEKVVKRGIPVVVATRCIQGDVTPSYNYVGGGKSIEKKSVIFSMDLSGPKSRLKLMLLLGQESYEAMEELKRAFEKKG